MSRKDSIRTAGIEAEGLVRRFKDVEAVAGIDLHVQPGEIYGFLGPNGAGKSTTMRMILGLDRPTAGTATVNGRHYAELSAPLREVGALLEARAVRPPGTAPASSSAPASRSGRASRW